MTAEKEARDRLEYLRGELRAERLSWSEVHELQSLAKFIDPEDVELLAAAGVPEKESPGPHSPFPWHIVPCFETGIAIMSGDLIVCEVWPVVSENDPHYGDGIERDAVAQGNARLIQKACENFESLKTHLKCAIWYWEVNLPKDAGPTELEDLNAARNALKSAS